MQFGAFWSLKKTVKEMLSKYNINFKTNILACMSLKNIMLWPFLNAEMIQYDLRTEFYFKFNTRALCCLLKIQYILAFSSQSIQYHLSQRMHHIDFKPNYLKPHSSNKDCLKLRKNIRF